MRIVVLGGGVAGLSAATEALALDPQVEVRVLEARTRSGGLVHTQHRGGFVLEHGPDSLASGKPEGMDLLRRLGLESRIVTGAGTPRVAYVAQGTRLVPLPPGLMAFRRGAALDIMRSPLLSLRGKLRVLKEPLCGGRAAAQHDESLAAFVTRRFGRELLERIVEPLVGSVYGTDPARMSAHAALPSLVQLEEAHGSIGMALLRGAPRRPAHLPYLVSLADGMGTLPRVLSARLAGRIHVGQRARRVERTRHGFRVHTQTGDALEADRLIMAVPAYAAAELTAPLDADLAGELSAIEYNSIASLHFAFRSERVHHAMQGTGFVVPARENRALSACSWVSRKWPRRAPERLTLLRCFLRSHAGDDQALIDAALHDLRDYMGVMGKPELSHVLRIERALPRYTLEHRSRVERIERRLAGIHGLTVCGSMLRGMGVPECVASGRRAALEMLQD
ncbi:MAG TPA: protoporphyrinogen oxidase [Polyangiales bacterium]